MKLKHIRLFNESFDKYEQERVIELLFSGNESNYELSRILLKSNPELKTVKLQNFLDIIDSYVLDLGKLSFFEICGTRNKNEFIFDDYLQKFIGIYDLGIISIEDCHTIFDVDITKDFIDFYSFIYLNCDITLPNKLENMKDIILTNTMIKKPKCDMINLKSLIIKPDSKRNIKNNIKFLEVNNFPNVTTLELSKIPCKYVSKFNRLEILRISKNIGDFVDNKFPEEILKNNIIKYLYIYETKITKITSEILNMKSLEVLIVIKQWSSDSLEIPEDVLDSGKVLYLTEDEFDDSKYNWILN